MSILDHLKTLELTNGDLSVGVLNYGARTTYLRHKGIDLTLYYPNIEDYVTGIPYVGAIVGRVANRIAGAAFELNGKRYELSANEGRNQLHGGPNGVSQKIWDMERMSESKVRLSLHSPDGDEGYPGNVDLEVVMSLDSNALEYEFKATTDAPTFINLAQHSYYVIDIEDALLRVDADLFTDVDPEQIPIGTKSGVDGTVFDYRTFAKIDPSIDHNLILNGLGQRFWLETQKRVLSFTTDQYGLQVYSGSGLGAPFAPNAGIALEPQSFPNAVNEPNFDKPLTTPEYPYSQKLRIEISRL